MNFNRFDRLLVIKLHCYVFIYALLNCYKWLILFRIFLCFYDCKSCFCCKQNDRHPFNSLFSRTWVSRHQKGSTHSGF